MRDRYWRNYDFYGLLHGCGVAAPAAVYGALSRDACLQRCSSRWDCQAVAHHQEQASCRLYTQCEDGELGSQPCAEEWCGYMRASWLGTAALKRANSRGTPMLELRDRPRAVPTVPLGENANLSAMLALCPHGEFVSCFSGDLHRRYKVHALFVPRKLPWREPVQNAQRVFSRLGRNCTAAPLPPPPPSSPPSPASLLGFAYAALAASEDLHASVGAGGPAPLPASRRAALQALQAPASAAATRRAPRLSCASRSVDLDAQLLMMVGVPLTLTLTLALTLTLTLTRRSSSASSASPPSTGARWPAACSR